MDEAPGDVVQDGEQGAAAHGDGPTAAPRFVHVLGRVAHPHRWAVQHGDVLGHAPRHLDCGDGVGVERQMGSVLLEARHRHQNEIFVLEVGLDIGHGQVAEVPRDELGPKVLIPFGEVGQPLGFELVAAARDHNSVSFEVGWLERGSELLGDES
jgi:hypothetical protein